MSRKIYPKKVGECALCHSDIIAKNSGFNKPNRKYCSTSCRATATNPSRIWTPEARAAIRARIKQTWAEGKITHHHDPIYLASLSKRYRGSNSHFWKGGKTNETRLIRNSAAYKNWRKHVFQRDNYTCQACKARSAKGNSVILNADHVLSFAQYPDLRFEILNGQTLCLPCHKKTPTFAVKSAYLTV